MSLFILLLILAQIFSLFDIRTIKKLNLKENEIESLNINKFILATMPDEVIKCESTYVLDTHNCIDSVEFENIKWCHFSHKVGNETKLSKCIAISNSTVPIYKSIIRKDDDL